MEQLVSMVSEKAGITEDQAGKAVEAVMSFLKEKAPAPIAGQLDGLVSGEGLASKLGGLGGMLGK